MNRSPTTLPIVIFEGPDGAGKSTMAKVLAEHIGARYLHHGPYKHANVEALPHFYFESMLPALEGYQPVVLDRSWMSEPIYGLTYRKSSRAHGPYCAMLERAAMRGGAVVVNCRPPWRTVRDNFIGRKGDEYLDNLEQLRQVYDMYESLNTELHEVVYDYTNDQRDTMGIRIQRLMGSINTLRERNPLHPIGVRSSGNDNAQIVIVGDSFAEHKPMDSYFQYPFQSFSRTGCSHWLASELLNAGIPEQSLLWINADELTKVEASRWIARHGHKHFITLGAAADVITTIEVLHAKSITHVPHPQYWLRFKHGQPYPLIAILKEKLRELHDVQPDAVASDERVDELAR